VGLRQQKNMKKANITKLIISIAVCQAAGLVGSVFTAPAITGWYASLVKPAFNPPGWIFGPVWTTLYTLMGILNI
jgi:benzodiazapine receptor